MIHIFQAVAEQPEWLDTVLNLWSEAGGWVKALVALLGTIPIGAIALGIKGTLKNRKLNGNIITTLNIVKELKGGLDETVKALEVIANEVIKEQDKSDNLLKLVNTYKTESEKVKEQLTLIIGLNPAPIDIKKEVIGVVENQEVRNVVLKAIENDEMLTEELNLTLDE
mgnify:FL=1